MTTILFLLFLALILLHFLYEGAIAPSLRLKLKYDLFAIRDKLRALKGCKPNNFSDEVYLYLQNSINNLIKSFSIISILSITKAEQRFNKDEKLRQQVIKITRILEDCKSSEVQEVRSNIRRSFTVAIVINNGMLLLYSLPFFLLTLYAKAFLKRAVSAIQEVLYVPEREFDKMMSLS